MVDELTSITQTDLLAQTSSCLLIDTQYHLLVWFGPNVTAQMRAQTKAIGAKYLSHANEEQVRSMHAFYQCSVLID